jgi:hypothetical protein
LGLEVLGGLCERRAGGGGKVTASCIILLDRMHRCKKVPWWYFWVWGWDFEGQIYPRCLAEEKCIRLHIKRDYSKAVSSSPARILD